MFSTTARFVRFVMYCFMTTVSVAFYCARSDEIDALQIWWNGVSKYGIWCKYIDLQPRYAPKHEIL